MFLELISLLLLKVSAFEERIEPFIPTIILRASNVPSLPINSSLYKANNENEDMVTKNEKNNHFNFKDENEPQLEKNNFFKEDKVEPVSLNKPFTNEEAPHPHLFVGKSPFLKRNIKDEHNLNEKEPVIKAVFVSRKLIPIREGATSVFENYHRSPKAMRRNMFRYNSDIFDRRNESYNDFAHRMERNPYNKKRLGFSSRGYSGSEIDQISKNEGHPYYLKNHRMNEDAAAGPEDYTAIEKIVKGKNEPAKTSAIVYILKTLIFFVFLGVSGMIGFYFGKLQESKNYVRVGVPQTN